MVIRMEKSFLKDWRNEKNNKSLNRKIETVLLSIGNASNLKEISNIKHLKADYYRLKIGDYRLGFRLVNGELVFEKLLHRREMYRYYPPK